MLSGGHQEKLIGEITRISYESSTVDDLARMMPLFQKAFGTSQTILYKCNEEGLPIGVGGALEIHRVYTERYFLSDPMHQALRYSNRKIFPPHRVPEWKTFLKHAVYNEHAKHYDIDFYLLLRLTEAIPFDHGMVGLLLARSRRQPDFSEQEELLLGRLLPSLEALVRRNARVEKLLGNRQIFEGMVSLDPRPKLAFDVHGSLLWASERAEKLIGFGAGKRRVLPEALVQAARRLGALTTQETSSTLSLPLVTFTGAKSEPIRADLRLARTRSGEAFVLAELEVSDFSPQLAEAAARYRLTTTETQVLDLLAQGCSDQKIGGRLFISLATVRTHVGRILSKMGVRSRVQAALLCHGVKTELDPE